MDVMKEYAPVDIVIITALKDELNAVLAVFDEKTPSIEQKGPLSAFRGRIQNEVLDRPIEIVAIQAPGMGNVAAAQTVARAIDVWNPSHLILAGIAGGVKSKDIDSLGDVVIADQIVGYEPGKVRNSGLEHRWEVFRPTYPLLTAAREISQQDWWKIISKPRPSGGTSRPPKAHFGVVASGEKVIASADTIKDLKSVWSKLAAVEMEGYGSAFASYTSASRTGFLMAKSLSDWSNSKKDDRWREYACSASASFLRRLIQRFSFDPPPGPEKQPHKTDRKPFSGRNKIELCRRLGNSWEDLADYFEIPPWERARFKQGRECQGIWEWLELRRKLEALLDGLRFIDRGDLADILTD